MMSRVLVVCIVVAGMPAFAHAYGQGSYYSQGTYYSQSSYYSQSYYQAYYQSYYQGSYQTTFTSNVTMENDLSVASQVSKSSGSFVIDHPLDPVNKLLYHSFVESPDAKNFYDGVAVLDGDGEATVRLPDYFEVLNKDFRYQLKPIGSPMPHLYIKEEVQGNQFSIAGGTARGRVSWQVTGTRQDAYIKANPIVPEVRKGPGQLVDTGKYLFPDAYEKRNELWLFSWSGSFRRDERSPGGRVKTSFLTYPFVEHLRDWLYGSEDI